MRKRNFFAAVGIAVAALLGFAFPASATTDDGGYWTGHIVLGGIDMQGYYINNHTYPGAAPITQADGGACSASSHGYIRMVVVSEYLSGSLQASRTVNYTGSSKTASFTNIPDNIVPYMNATAPNTSMSVRCKYSDGADETAFFPIHQ